VPIYTFYPYAAGGSALVFEAIDLADDGVAMRHAERLLGQHASAAEVVVWEGDRQVHREIRAPATPRGAGDEPPVSRA
jgi:hypothetical protein